MATINDLTAEIAKVKASAAAEIAALNAEVAALTSENAALKAQIPDSAVLDQAVSDLGGVVQELDAATTAAGGTPGTAPAPLPPGGETPVNP